MLNLSKMRRPLFVIEAPGKIEKLRNLLSGLDIYHGHIEATKGRLYDLPRRDLGINLENFSIESLVPLNEKKISFLIDQIEKSSHVLLMTDSDIEGELIAYQASQLVSSLKPVSRLDLHSMTKEGLIKALASERSIDPKKVISGYSRRVYDRLVGYGCSTTNWSNPEQEIRGNVGRILSPVLQELHSQELTIGFLQKSVNLNGEEFFIDIELKQSHYENLEEIVSQFKNLDTPSLREVDMSVMDDDTHIADGPSFLSGISESLEMSVIDAEDVIQELYEDGDASYPRTDSFYLSDETIRDITALAEHFDVQEFDPDVLKEKAKSVSETYPSQEAHEALHPLTDRLNPFSSLSSYELKDQALILLLRSAFRSGQKDRKIQRRTAIIDSRSKNIEQWNSFSNAYGLNFNIHRTTTFINKRKSHTLLNEAFSPMGVSIGEQDGNTKLRMIPKDLLVYNLMRKLQLGRPSTLATHASKIARSFVSKDYSITYKGIQCLNKTGMLAHRLLDSSIAKEIEHNLLNLNSTSNTENRVTSALKNSGIDLIKFKENLKTLSNTRNSNIDDESTFDY